jgi:hypothetical protein
MVALVALQGHAQHLRLALRTVEVDRVPIGVLGNAHLLSQARALIDQLLQLLINAVDLLTDSPQLSLGITAPGNCLTASRHCLLLA